MVIHSKCEWPFHLFYDWFNIQRCIFLMKLHMLWAKHFCWHTWIYFFHDVIVEFCLQKQPKIHHFVYVALITLLLLLLTFTISTVTHRSETITRFKKEIVFKHTCSLVLQSNRQNIFGFSSVG